MVKTPSYRTKASSSTPSEDKKFSHNVLVKTEKIIKFAKLLQDFIILQQNEILPYCVDKPIKQEGKKETDEIISDNSNITEISSIKGIKRKPGRPPKAREFLSENGIDNYKTVSASSSHNLRKIKSEMSAETNNGKPIMVKCGVDSNGLPLYRLKTKTPIKRSNSIPSDVIKAVDDYILQQDYTDKWPPARDDPNNEESFVSATEASLQ